MWRKAIFNIVKKPVASSFRGVTTDIAPSNRNQVSPQQPSIPVQNGKFSILGSGNSSLISQLKSNNKIVKSNQLFEYRTWKEEDLPDIVDFILKNFAKREVLMSSHLNYTDDNALHNTRKYVQYNIEEAHQQGASFLARDMFSGKVRGVRVNGIGMRNGLELLQDFGTQMNSVARFMHTSEIESFSRNQNSFMRHVIVCVDPKVLKCGVATKLNLMCHEFAAKRGLERLTATCTSSLPENLAKKCGFRLHATVSYKDYAVKNRQHMCNNVYNVYMKLARDHGYCRIMVKDI